MASTTAVDASDRRWFIQRRWQEFEGEGRTNLLRVLAVAGYYMVHLATYVGVAERSAADQAYHRHATLLAAGWVFVSLAVLVALRRHYLPAAMKYVTTGLDLLLLTALAWLGSGPQSPLVTGYFVIVASAALRFSLPLVWSSTLGAMACYLALVGKHDAMWFDAQHATPVVQQLSMLLSLGLTGIVLGQVLRRVRSMVLERVGTRDSTGTARSKRGQNA
jgi:hypothetical protein